MSRPTGTRRGSAGRAGLPCITFSNKHGATQPRSPATGPEAGEVDPRLLEYKVRGDWWEMLARVRDHAARHPRV